MLRAACGLSCSARYKGTSFISLDTLELSKMATWKQYNGYLHKSISTPQLGLALRLALLLFLGGKKTQLLGLAQRLALLLFLGGKKPQLQESVALASRTDLVVVAPKYRLNMSEFFTANSSEEPGMLLQRQALDWLRACISSCCGHTGSTALQEYDSGASSHGSHLLNRASLSVLEGLNACLDYRAEVFVPELNRSFMVGRSRFFGCQNPHQKGGAMRGLPHSFLNRFVQLGLEPLNRDDLLTLVRYLHPALPEDTLSCMVLFNEKVSACCALFLTASGNCCVHSQCDGIGYRTCGKQKRHQAC
ncbi:hypothetical protein V5799_002863 [Amblyomma americanum]|uniref:Carboxylesterase type B domain-containing protein n=1 Tax=Amblyomma americanum TaxID=6943 RepID=A0AAQ4DAL6_AMBAM